MSDPDLLALAEQIAASEAAGDHRAAAIATAALARAREERGDRDEARRLRARQVEHADALGDPVAQCGAEHAAAMLDLQDRRWTAALPRLARAWNFAVELQSAVALVTIGEPLGQLLLGAGDTISGVEVLDVARRAALQLGRAETASRLAEMSVLAAGAAADRDGPAES